VLYKLSIRIVALSLLLHVELGVPHISQSSGNVFPIATVDCRVMIKKMLFEKRCSLSPIYDVTSAQQPKTVLLFTLLQVKYQVRRSILSPSVGHVTSRHKLL
jgi:hypothetical protein